MPLFIVLFLVVPLIEIYLLIEVGQVIGALPTIALCVLTAFIGGGLLRHQGLQTLGRARANLDRGNVPAFELLEGLALAIGGALLLTPGFVTDAIGFACLIPFTRRWLVQVAFKRLHVTYGSVEGEARRRPDGANEPHRTIEGEYQRRDDD